MRLAEPLHNALHSTVRHFEAMKETGDRATLQVALSYWIGRVEEDDPRSAELLTALVEATR